jgi:hypothetical protein
VHADRIDTTSLSPPKAHLICVYGDCQPPRVALLDQTVLIGRIAPADLRIPLTQVSRQHASVAPCANGFVIVDLNSRNGTYVNSDAVKSEPRVLRHGDEIVLAGVAVLRFVAESSVAAAAASDHGVRIDIARRDVFVDACRLDPPLSAAQFALLSLLRNRDGNIVTRADIARHVWPDAMPNTVSADAVDCLIKRVRARIRAATKRAEDGQSAPDYVDVVRGHGVRLIGPVREA